MAAKEKPGMRQLVVLLLLLLLAGERKTVGLTDDGMALIDVKDALLDPGRALKTWDKNLVNPCSWEGVTCLANSSVSTLLLQGKGLSGTLSPSIGKLSSLGTWRMGNNNISGELPGEIGQLQQLGFMDLGNNSFSGSIPVSLTGMLALNTLILEFNELSGSIPANLTSLPQLTRLDLSHNNLSGPVPEYRPGLTFDVTGNPLLQCGESPLPDCPGEAEAASSSGSGTGSSSKGSKAGVAAGAAAGGLAVLLAAGGGLLFWKKRREQEMAQEFFDVQDEQGPQIRYAQLREFTLRELNAATDQFSSRNVIGQGGFGKVFRGTLEDGSEVAVKRLNRDGHGGLGGGIGGNGMAGNGGGGGERAFQTEVEIISMAVHRNLLRLLGYCVTQAERMLVYPFMRHGSVASRLRDSTSSSSGGGEPALDWAARRKIALGAARGLAYLHDFCQPKIIHRDVKAANVLLDDEMEAVVGDFGLAKLLDGSQTHITTMVRGTAGHIAPEYLTTGKSSEKTDVFGYGIMLLELLTGQRAFDFARLAAEDDVMLLDWVKRLEREGRQAELVDPNLRARYHPGQAQELIQVALLCTQASPGERPHMAEVVRMLEGDGLAERWQEWQRVELVRRRDSDHHLPRTLPQWVHDSTGNLDAIQLSSGR